MVLFIFGAREKWNNILQMLKKWRYLSIIYLTKKSVSNEDKTKTNSDEKKINISGEKGQTILEQLFLNIGRLISRPRVPSGGAAKVGIIP